MTATITDLRQWKRTHVARQCDSVSLPEAVAVRTIHALGACGAPPLFVRVASSNVRWGAAYLRDQMRQWWGV